MSKRKTICITETEKYKNRVELIESTCYYKSAHNCPICDKKPEVSCYPTCTIIECEDCGMKSVGHGALSDKQLIEGICYLVTFKNWNERIEKALTRIKGTK